MRIELNRLKCNHKRVNKSGQYTTILVFDDSEHSDEGNYYILDYESMEHMTLKFTWFENDQYTEVLRYCNYCHIPLFNRWYFVTERYVDTAQMLTLKLEEDYLMTWKSAIIGSTQIIARNTHLYDGHYPDPLYPILAPKSVVAKTIGGSPFSANNMGSSSRCIAFTVAGGGEVNA